MVWLDVKHPKPFDCQVVHYLDYQFRGFPFRNHACLCEGFGILPANPMKKGDVLPIKVQLNRLHAFGKTVLVPGKSIDMFQELMLRSAQLPRFELPTRRVNCERAFRVDPDMGRPELAASKLLKQAEFFEWIIENRFIKDMSWQSIGKP